MQANKNLGGEIYSQLNWEYVVHIHEKVDDIASMITLQPNAAFGAHSRLRMSGASVISVHYRWSYACIVLAVSINCCRHRGRHIGIRGHDLPFGMSIMWICASFTGHHRQGPSRGAACIALQLDLAARVSSSPPASMNDQGANISGRQGRLGNSVHDVAG